MEQLRPSTWSPLRRASIVLLSAFMALGGVSVPVSAEEDLSRCGAITLKGRPRLGKTGNWDSDPYVRRHNRFLRTRPRVFASGYLAGRHFYVGFTRNVCDNLSDFRRGLPQRWRVRAFKANFSYRQLRRAQRCVAQRMDDASLGISAVGTDVYRNRVEVMLERNTKRRRRTLRAECGGTRPRILYFTEGTVAPD